MQPAPSSPMLKFGPYILDIRAGELRKNGSKIRLQENPLRVLAALAEQQGQVVTRNELRKRLWPDDTFVDFETGLNTAVSKLRDALSDTADKPRFIETIPRRGYRFISAVEIVANSDPVAEAARIAPSPAVAAPSQTVTEVAPTPAAPPVAQQKGKTSIWIRAAIGACIAAVAFTIWWLTPLPEPRILNIYPVTTTGKEDFLVKPATDGVRIFYVQRAGDHYELMQSSVDGGGARKIEAPFPNTLIWDVSSDGSQYLMTSFALRGEPSPLWEWPAAGGAPVKLDDLVSGSAAWSNDARKIVYHAGHELWVANADGSEKKKLATFKEEPDAPQWSPDGEHIRFTLNDPDRVTHSIWEIRPDGGHLGAVLPGRQACCGTWSPDGRYFFFVDTTERIPRLWAIREKGDWLRRSPRGPFLLAAEATGSWSPLAGKDGKHVYFYASSLRLDLERLDEKSRRFDRFLPEGDALMPSFSRDGRWVSYVRIDGDQLWYSRIDGSEAHQVATPGFKVDFPQWSPDGRTLVFAGGKRREPVNIYRIPLEGGRPEALVPNGEGLSDPGWSPDGASVVVARTVTVSGKSDSVLAIINLKTREMRDIEGSERLYVPRWSPDGRYVAAVDDMGRGLKAVDMHTKEWRTLAQGKYVAGPAWAADSVHLYYQDVLEPGEPLFRVNVENGPVEKVADFRDVLASGVHRCAFLGLTPDGSPLIGFQRSDADIYGATVVLP